MKLKVKGTKCKGPSVEAVALEIPGKISLGLENDFLGACVHLKDIG